MGNDNILRRRRRLGARLDEITVLVVPPTLVPTILRQVHDDPLSGHLGVNKTVDVLLERYYWPGFSADVKRYIRECPACQRTFVLTPRPKAPLRSIPVGSPFDMLAIDFLELPRTTRGNRYVLVCSDYFTRWPEAFATTDQTSETVAKVLFDGVISLHGVPLTIHSDQGSSFESRVIQRLCQLMGVQKTRTTPYHPQGDRLVERLNRSLMGILRRYCADRPLEWDLWLPAALHAYRVTKQTSTGVSPFELLYGRKPRLPTDIACGSAPPVPTDTTEYLNQLHQQMNSAREIVDANLAAAQERQRHDAPVHVHQYQHGDWVYLHDPGRRRGKAHKLLSVWDGPFQILKKQGDNDVYKIKHTTKSRRRRWVHHDRLRPCYRRTNESTQTNGKSVHLPPESGTPSEQETSTSDSSPPENANVEEECTVLLEPAPPISSTQMVIPTPARQRRNSTQLGRAPSHGPVEVVSPARTADTPQQPEPPVLDSPDPQHQPPNQSADELTYRRPHRVSRPPRHLEDFVLDFSDSDDQS